MEIKNLSNTPISKIVQAIADSFANYFVPLPTDIPYWESRFKSARVDLELSFGLFVDKELAGFIINGIDEENGLKTAFNTGTGVTMASRGQGFIDKLYQYALPYFKERGIQRCSLEVIERNERAIHVYERIGFNISKRLKCFKGTIIPSPQKVTIDHIPFSEVTTYSKEVDQYYSWDNTSNAIKISGDLYRTYRVTGENGTENGYFVINPANGYIAQMEAYNADAASMDSILNGIAATANMVKINNVDTNRTLVTSALLKAGLDNYIDQYEMQMILP